VVALVVAVAVGGCSDAAQSATSESIPVPDRWASSSRTILPLGTIAIDDQRPAELTTAADRATVTLTDGTVATFERHELGEGDPATPTPPLDLHSAAAAEEVTAVEVVVDGARITATSPHPVRRDALDGLARSVVALPAPLATALADGGAIPPVVDEFDLDGVRFRRTLSVEAPTYGAGLLQMVEVLDRPDLDHDPATISGNGNSVGMDLDSSIPMERLKFVRDGVMHWLTALQPGTHPTVVGRDRLVTVADELTGLRYALVVDGDGDRAAELRIPTSGGPIRAGFSDAVD
jgi:hypothetical protein